MEVSRTAELGDIELGAQMRDTLTGFEGVVVGRADYVTGCAQALVERLLPTGDVAARWFDYPRLEQNHAKSSARLPEGARATGGPAPSAGASRPAPR